MANQDPRYILLTSAGLIAHLGRTEPNEDDVQRCIAALNAGGKTGWIAFASDSFYSRKRPKVTMIRVLVESPIPFSEVVQLLNKKAR